MTLRRRTFIVGLGAAATWPLGARAQPPAVPVVGFLHLATPGRLVRQLAEFRNGLTQAGYAEGRNVTVEYRWADGEFDRLSALADDLASRHVAVIAAFSLPAVQASKAASASIPVVFEIGGDAVKLGLVESLNRPGGNVTGFSQLGNSLAPKQLELLHEIAPNVATIGMIVNPENPNAASDADAAQRAARALGLRLLQMNVTDEKEIEADFASLSKNGIGALLVSATLSVGLLSDRITVLAAQHAIPAIYAWRDIVDAGGLMSYASDDARLFRQIGAYVGRILKGEKAGDLPVQQPTKFELVINNRAAKAIGLVIPESFLLRADEVIE